MGNNVTRGNGLLVVMVDWNDGALIPIAHVDSQDEADAVMADTHRTDNDAVLYTVQTTAYAR